jgi:hypothetical protein
MKETVRVAGGQGFWGDLLTAPIDQVRKGPIDYLMLDYLAEVTMSIVQKQKLRDPKAGYARDFVSLMQEILPDCVEKNIKVLSNAGGVNVPGCAAAIRDVARELGLSGKVKIGVVTGDDILGQLDDFLAQGVEINSMDDGTPLSTIRDRVQSANVYLGAAPLVEALDKGANIIVGGRLTDTGLTLAPLMHEFGWAFDDWNRVAAGTIAGHIIECGAQVSGGNCQYKWQEIPDMANIGFPIVEVSPNGEFIVTKHEGTGGRVNVPSVTEQLLYEMGDPKAYITPDVVADFSSINLADAGDRQSPRLRHRRQPEHRFLQSQHRLPRRLQIRRHARLRLARRPRKGEGRRPHLARTPRQPRSKVRSHPNRIRRRQRHARPSDWSADTLVRNVRRFVGRDSF